MVGGDENMCLDYVFGKEEEGMPKDIARRLKSGIGWKVFVMDEGKLSFVVMNNVLPLPVDKWMNELWWRTNLSRRISWDALDDKYYHTGFHVFLRKKEAVLYAIKSGDIVRKVMFEGVFAVGKQDDAFVAVVKKIKILGK
jgi:hypothetical protein